ncbi:HNH endonuclease [Candidatus Poriferisocius sp.]|uniref:HNH endonuclease n=1 Tax=Candidatus Poriferisocius sp. TaxID=3101276 RepID=UPI003B017CFF
MAYWPPSFGMGRYLANRKATVFNGDDGMVVLHAELDQVTGERVKTALDGSHVPRRLQKWQRPHPPAKSRRRTRCYARDKHCVNCGLRATACDVHHIKPWEHGGRTSINTSSYSAPPAPPAPPATPKPQPPPTPWTRKPTYSNVLLSP